MSLPSIFVLDHYDLLYVLSRLVSLSRQSVQSPFSFLSVHSSIQLVIYLVLGLSLLLEFVGFM